MSTEFKRISRTAVSTLGIVSLLAASLAITSPAPAQAENSVAAPATLAEANAAIDGTISSMNQQAGSLQGQIGETDGRIAQLETKNAALKEEQQRDEALVSQTIRDAYIAGNPSEVEVIASNNSFSGVVGQQTYRSQVSEKVQAMVEKVEEGRKKIEENIEEQKDQRDGLVAMKGQLDQKIATAQAQEQAKAALAEMTLNDEKNYQEVRAQQATQTVAAAVTPRNSGGGSGYSGGNAAGLMGSLGYARAGGNCVNEPGINNPRNGNPINWPVLTGTPSIGATALWTYNHTGVVTGIWSNGDIEVRHQNYTGNQTRFPRGAFRGFR